MAAELKLVKNSRKFYRGKMTRKFHQLQKNLDNLSLEDKNVYLDEFKDLKGKLKKFNRNVARGFRKVKHTKEELEKERESCAVYEQKCMEAIRHIEAAIVRDSRPGSYFDALPDEIILKILENMETLIDLSNVVRVSRRFNRLVNEGKWRKHIFISKEKFQRFSEDGTGKFDCIDSLREEINDSIFFDTLTIEFPMHINCHMKKLIRKFENNISRLDNLIGTCTFYASTNITHVMLFFSPKHNGADFGRTLRYHPPNTTSLEFRGEDIMTLEKVVNLCKETLLEFSFEGEMTLPLLRLLVKCKKLQNVILTGKLNLPNDGNDVDLPKIRSKLFYFRDYPAKRARRETSNMIRDMFFSDALHSLDILSAFLIGAESVICSKCPNLRLLYIWNAANFPKRMFSFFYKNLLMHLNQHLLIYEVQFYGLNSSLKSILIDLMDRYLTGRYTICNEAITFRLRLPQRDWSPPSMVLKP